VDERQRIESVVAAWRTRAAGDAEMPPGDALILVKRRDGSASRCRVTPLMHRTLDQLDHDLELIRRGERMLDDASDRLRKARHDADPESGDGAAPAIGGRVLGRL
jgi:hypothetical protein